MYRGSYFISIRNKEGQESTQLVKGYIFDKYGEIYGARKNGRVWDITHLKTGCIVNRQARKKDQIIDQITEELADIIKNLDGKLYKPLFDRITASYNQIGFIYEIIPD